MEHRSEHRGAARDIAMPFMSTNQGIACKRLSVALLLMALCLVFLAMRLSAAANDSFVDPALDLLSKMTDDEKIGLLHGVGWGKDVYVGKAIGIPRLGVPDIKINDGPQGYRCNGMGKCPSGTSTAFPSGVTIAATWDVDAARQWGMQMGKEFYMKGATVQLGPGLEVARVPKNGRNFEYISGEDPYLGRVLAGPVVQGIQSQGVVANAKHWVFNNQETARKKVSVDVDERTRFEIYYPPFKGAIDADIGSFMCSYNRIGGVYSCENNQTLNTELKGHLGFKGWVMSDWRATHTTSILEGLDQEMPESKHMNDVLKQSKYSQAVDQSVLRILRPLISAGVIAKPNNNSDDANVSTPESMQVAHDLASRSMVLLKNKGDLLPLNATSLRRIAVIGSDAVKPTVGGGGSGRVDPSYLPSPLESITSFLAAKTGAGNNCSEGNFEDGIDYFQEESLGSSPGTGPADCCTQCARTLNCKYYSFKKSNSICYFKANKSGRRKDTNIVSGGCLPNLSAAQVIYAEDVINGKVAAASADVAIVLISTSSKEGHDRTDLGFGHGDSLVEEISVVQPNIVVAAVSPGVVLLPWDKKVKSILLPFMPGQMYADALTGLLFGQTSPAGRLPITLPNKENEMEFTEEQYPGRDEVVRYSEGLLVGYRWYNAHNVTALFCFGHGLSYTSFSYSDLAAKVTPGQVKVSFRLVNTGKAAGHEVPQLYLGFPAAADEPPKVLRGFQKVALQAGEARTLTFTLIDEDMSVWDPSQHKWVRPDGSFSAMVGASSCDIRLNTSFSPKAGRTIVV